MNYLTHTFTQVILTYSTKLSIKFIKLVMVTILKGKQNEQQLLIIMRSMYLQYGKNMNSNIQYQVDELNNMVIDECVRIIIPNIQQQQGYIDDITSGIKVMSYAQNVSSKSKQLNGFDSVIPS